MENKKRKKLFFRLIAAIKQSIPITKNAVARFTSYPTREKKVCQGLMAIKKPVNIAKVLFLESSYIKKYKAMIVKDPNNAEIKRTANAFTPNTFIASAVV